MKCPYCRKKTMPFWKFALQLNPTKMHCDYCTKLFSLNQDNLHLLSFVIVAVFFLGLNLGFYQLSYHKPDITQIIILFFLIIVIGIVLEIHFWSSPAAKRDW